MSPANHVVHSSEIHGMSSRGAKDLGYDAHIAQLLQFDSTMFILLSTFSRTGDQLPTTFAFGVCHHDLDRTSTNGS